MIIKSKKAGILAIIIALGFIYQFKSLNQFPSHIHAWAQSDRYALSLGFHDNGLNFFMPQTMVYNHQFPHNWQVPSETTITAVDFPIHDYIPAVIMKITGSTSPLIFRLYILMYSFLGLFFLFKLSFIITGNYIKSGFVTIFAATSPVFVYYQGGFLPTIPSLSNAIIGIYFYTLYLNKNTNKYFWLGVLWLTFAALSRTTFAIPLVALLGVEFLRLLQRETKLVPKLIPVGISGLLLVAYMVYNGYLRAQYGSIFLNQLLPAENLAHAKELIQRTYQNWFFQYFTKIHYLVFSIILVLSVYVITTQKPDVDKPKRYLGLLTLVYGFGCLVFALLMLRQFPAHDYYFLDTFYLPIIMALILLFAFLPLPVKANQKIIAAVTLGLVALLLLLNPIKSQDFRRTTGSWDRTTTTINNFNQAYIFLDSLEVSKNAKILVIDAVAPNIPFILMHRKGYAVMSTTAENIESALTWNSDYVVFQNEFFIPEIYTPYPAILTKLNKIADNGKLSVCKLTHENPQTLNAFLGLESKVPVLSQTVSFEATPDNLWTNFTPTTQKAFSGKSAGYLAPDVVYGLTYKIRHLPVLESNSRTLFFSSYFQKNAPINCEIIVSIHTDGQNSYYKSIKLQNLIINDGVWEQVSQVFQLPKIQSKDYEFAIFIWNTGNSELYYDNFEFSIY